VRLAGAGNAGQRGGEPGDFVLVVHVEPHAVYRREGEDLHCEVPITITEAALGGHVEVQTPEGAVVIEIPAGTQAGQRFRLRKRGLPRLGEPGRGDLYVEARVWVPRVQDDESRELLREFERRNPANPRHPATLAPAAGQKGS
jgi:DnaJ-class molecular chaperone